MATAILTEPRTGAVRGWLRSHADADWAGSAWVATELASVLAVAVRRGEVDLAGRAAARAAYAAIFGAVARMLPVTDDDIRLATAFVDRHELGLRAPDALHLAICAAHGATLCTLDRRQAAAGTALGVATELV